MTNRYGIGVNLNGYHSYEEYNCYMTNKTVGFPELQKDSVRVPGRNGILDMTESLMGEPRYYNREIAIELTCLSHPSRWPSVMDLFMDRYHGRKTSIIFDDEPDYIYLGRCEVDPITADRKILMHFDCDPYKLEQISSDDDWIWDTFNFETGIIREFKDIIVDDGRTVNIVGSQRPTVLVVYAEIPDESALYLSAENAAGEMIDYYLHDGKNTLPDVVIRSGSNFLRFTGYGKISISYRGGRL